MKFLALTFLLFNLQFICCLKSVFDQGGPMPPVDMIAYLQSYQLLKNEFKNLLENNESFAPLPNISELCAIQFLEFIADLKGPKKWSLYGNINFID